MFNDGTKPSLLPKLIFLLRSNLHYHLSFKKRFSYIKVKPIVMGIWNISVYGPNIELCGMVKMFAANGNPIFINTIKQNGQEGRIRFGDDVLVMNGVRIGSASKIVIGDHCMLASFCYLMDSDWHDVYDRKNSGGKTAPIILKNNVWIGDSAIVCKGVTIGENSVVGAGAVVTKDVPPNVVVAGNPARVVKKLDPGKIVIRNKTYNDINPVKIEEAV